MPVEFLTDDQAAAYGRYNAPAGPAQLERFFFLDDTDKVLVGKRRGDHNRLGFAVQLASARYVGTFLADPVDAPSEVVDYLAEQLGIADPSCVKQYSQRDTTHREHAEEIHASTGCVISPRWRRSCRRGWMPEVAFLHADKAAEPWARYAGRSIKAP
jgi:TnpA family transposase